MTLLGCIISGQNLYRHRTCACLYSRSINCQSFIYNLANLWLLIDMLRNYLKTAWRSLARGRSFSVINISGLIVGMAGATLILLWLFNEVSYDRFHVNGDRIYQVYGMTDIPGEK